MTGNEVVEVITDAGRFAMPRRSIAVVVVALSAALVGCQSLRQSSLFSQPPDEFSEKDSKENWGRYGSEGRAAGRRTSENDPIGKLIDSDRAKDINRSLGYDY